MFITTIFKQWCDPDGVVSLCTFFIYKYVNPSGSFFIIIFLINIYPFYYTTYFIKSRRDCMFIKYLPCFICATPLGSYNITLIFCYKYMNPSGSFYFSSIHLNKYSFLNSILNFSKKSKYSSLKVFFLWCSF